MDYLFQMLVVYAADDVNQTTKKSSELRKQIVICIPMRDGKVLLLKSILMERLMQKI